MARIQVIIPDEDENITYIVSDDFANYICQEIEEKINKEHRIDFIRKLGEIND